jgi:cvfA/B/C family virulence factor
VAEYRVLCWQDIPSVIKVAGDDGGEVSRQLPDAFQQAIDSEAMRQGLVGSDAYLEQWRWTERQERPGSADRVLDELTEEFERQLADRRGA